MVVALAVLVVGALGLVIALGIEIITENREEKENESNSR